MCSTCLLSSFLKPERKEETRNNTVSKKNYTERDTDTAERIENSSGYDTQAKQ